LPFAAIPGSALGGATLAYHVVDKLMIVPKFIRPSNHSARAARSRRVDAFMTDLSERLSNRVQNFIGFASLIR
jgi:hypothetical protein